MIVKKQVGKYGETQMVLYHHFALRIIGSWKYRSKKCKTRYARDLCYMMSELLTS